MAPSLKSFKIYFREVFDSILREVRCHLGLKSSVDVENAANFTVFVDKLSDILTSTATSTNSCVIALSNAEILRSLDPLLLPGNFSMPTKYQRIGVAI